MAIQQKKDPMDDMLPVMAKQVLSQAAGGEDTEDDRLLKQLFREMLQDRLKARELDKQKLERMALNAAQAAKEADEEQRRKQAMCSHRKQNGKTRVVCSRLSNGQLWGVCQWCNKTFHNPTLAGQNPLPVELVPPADEIGG